MKYRLPPETARKHGDVTLVRVVRCSDGLVGGWVEHEGNLSHSGKCFVYGEATVSGDAKVYGDSRVFGRATVRDHAQVGGKARVSGSSTISGRARIDGSARVYGSALVTGDCRVTGHAVVKGQEVRKHGLLSGVTDTPDIVHDQTNVVSGSVSPEPVPYRRPSPRPMFEKADEPRLTTAQVASHKAFWFGIFVFGFTLFVVSLLIRFKSGA